MNLVHCYRLLGLRQGAAIEEIKASYRRLARKYHPDANTGNQKDPYKFVKITEAYKFLLSILEKTENQQIWVDKGAKIVSVTEEPTATESLAELSQYDRQLKWDCYANLKNLLQEGKFVRAIALVEALAQRIPQDLEVRQWQAIVYQQWGRQLLRQKQLEKAQKYLQKALHTDPHNRALGIQVQQDLARISKECIE